MASAPEAYRMAGRFVAAVLIEGDCRKPENRAVTLLAGLLAQDRGSPGAVTKTDFDEAAALCTAGAATSDEEAMTLLTAQAEELVHFHWATIRRLAEVLLTRKGQFSATDLARFLRRELPGAGRRRRPAPGGEGAG